MNQKTDNREGHAKDDWIQRCRIISDYMPPYPQPDTKPSIQVEYKDGDNGAGEGLFLRWFEDSDTFVWDIYGTHFESIEQAKEVLARATSPVGARVYEHFTS